MESLVAFCLLSLVSVWAILRPLLVAPEQVQQGELRYSEMEDLARFSESIEFELARGLISKSEYDKQKAKVSARQGNIQSEIK